MWKGHYGSLVPSLSNPQIFIACSMKNRGRKPGRVSHVIRAADVTRLFVHRSNTSIEGVYMVTSLFYYLPAVWPRMRERTVLQTYEGGDKVNFISDACFLLDYCYRAVSAAISAVCVAGSVLPSPTTGSRTQEGFFMSIEWSDQFCDTFTAGILFLPQINVRVDS